MAVDTWHIDRSGIPGQPAVVPGMGLVEWAYGHQILPDGPTSNRIDWVNVDASLAAARSMAKEVGGPVPLILDIEDRPPDEALAKIVSHIRARRDQLFHGVPLWMYPLSYWDDPNCHTLMLEDPERYERWRKARAWIGRTFGPLLDCYVPHFYLEHDWDQDRVLAHGQVFLPTMAWAMPLTRVRPALWHNTNWNPFVPASIRRLTVGEARACRWCAHKYAHGGVFWTHSYHSSWEWFIQDPAVRVFLNMPVGGADFPGGHGGERWGEAEFAAIADRVRAEGFGPGVVHDTAACSALFAHGPAALPEQDVEAWERRIRDIPTYAD